MAVLVVSKVERLGRQVQAVMIAVAQHAQLRTGSGIDKGIDIIVIFRSRLQVTIGQPAAQTPRQAWPATDKTSGIALAGHLWPINTSMNKPRNRPYKGGTWCQRTNIN